MRIEARQVDITLLALDAIVNAATQSLLGGAGVDGAIHAAAGPALLRACKALPEVKPGVRCPTGEARITPGFNLASRPVIHTVGPIFRDGLHGEPERLASCYRESLALAEHHGLEDIAFPAISCGIYAYPPELAVPIAVREVRDWLANYARPRRVIFACFSASMLSLYHMALAKPQRETRLGGSGSGS